MERLIRPLNIDNYIISPGGRFDSVRPGPTGLIRHQANDYPVQIGLPIYASNTGFLYDISNSSCGIGVKIVGDKQISNYQTAYCHLSAIKPDILNELNSTGVYEVNQGEIIGFTGNTGNSTGPHLHYKIRDVRTGIPLDPEIQNYKRFNYAGPNWFGIFFGLFSVLALIHAYKDEKRRAKK